MNRSSVPLLAVVVGLALLSGCTTPPALAVFDTGSQVQLRSYQSRTFPGNDREKALRGVIGTMQDLGFVIDKADAVLGTVTGTKLAGYEVRQRFYEIGSHAGLNELDQLLRNGFVGGQTSPP